jgi:DNA-binding CsgD family transcriptional regulator
VGGAAGAPADRAAQVAHQRRLVADLCRLLDPQPGPAPRRNGHAGPNARTGGNGHAGAGGDGNGGAPPPPPPPEFPLPPGAVRLSPRMHQTLERLLAGDGEKEIAARFGRSRHTVHVYVKKLYERFAVSSRGELFALFVRAPLAPPAPGARRPVGSPE